ncbi:putative sterol carrier protein [Hydrogenivirga caldilitoris]|uniref:Putative sterol carrier protein n=1 Tax=Hydrogenivirga caldilitoris TaxID=246264 RepID=A0A497XS36_9AQUI|nr:SCP2 sterol-binding domain-containing protein [Hydrogenivirga caldilitoris]RLJ71094.1 putative sterol carrier protein [Hydrogenivirga caldilitoris]
MKRVLFSFLLAGGVSLAQPVFMDGEWAKAFCEVWNNTPALVNELGQNDAWKEVPERKLFLYRKDCGDEKIVQLTIKNENNQAMCVYGGPKKDDITDNDFLMYADTERWLEMGRKEYGPMRAMMFGRLKFRGPKFVAMKNMGPFESFLDAVDEVKSDTNKCP